MCGTPNMCFRNKRKELNLWKANNENPIIQLVGLGKQFPDHEWSGYALEDIQFGNPVWRGVRYHRPVRAGKSTLVRCINYLEVPTSGKVVFEGKNLSVMKDGEKAFNSKIMAIDSAV